MCCERLKRRIKLLTLLSKADLQHDQQHSDALMQGAVLAHHHYNSRLLFFFLLFVELVFLDWTLYSVINIYGWMYPSAIKFKCVLPQRLYRGPLGIRRRYTLNRRCQHKSHVVSPLNKTHALGHFIFVLLFLF